MLWTNLSYRIPDHIILNGLLGENMVRSVRDNEIFLNTFRQSTKYLPVCSIGLGCLYFALSKNPFLFLRARYSIRISVGVSVLWVLASRFDAIAKMRKLPVLISDQAMLKEMEMMENDFPALYSMRDVYFKGLLSMVEGKDERKLIGILSDMIRDAEHPSLWQIDREKMTKDDELWASKILLEEKKQGFRNQKATNRKSSLDDL